MAEQVQIKTTVNCLDDQRQRYLCPFCGKHTVLWVFPTTEVKNLPIKCKLCGKESIININPESEV
ncbi:MAG: conjugal transfer protein [Clostridia bacterium]|nr:conjugal transfer protein [Clostridia bacterium]